MPRSPRLALLLALAATGCSRWDMSEDPLQPRDPSVPVVEPPVLALPSPDPCGAETPEECRHRGDRRSFSRPGETYNPILGVRLHESACLHGNPRACGEAGDAWSHHGENVVNAPPDDRPACEGKDDVSCQFPHDYPRATALYERGCELGSARACSSAGELRLIAYAYMSEDRARARILFEKACDASDREGCYRLGRMHWDGKLGRRSPATAQPFLEKACALGAFEACGDLAFMFKEGFGVPANPERAFPLYQRLCQDNDRNACVPLGEMYLDGRGTPRDVPKAIELFSRDCDSKGFLASGWGCARLAKMYQQGDGVPRDPEKARKLYAEACDRRDYEACKMLKWFQWREILGDE